MLRTLAGVLLTAASAVGYTKEALLDEVTVLPGAPAVNFKMFSGYVDIGGGKQIFYMMAESQSNPTVDPIVVWTNGGPGCSGLGGFMTEQGPFRPTANGSLVVNPDAWNKVATMVFIEQPAGVGFSQAPADMKYGDEEAATDNHQFLLNLLVKYPQYKANNLFISSESYGGHYMPTLAVKIVKSADIPNFKGVFLGNPLTDMVYRNYGQFGTYGGHNLLPKPMFDKYLAAGCRENDVTPECQAIEDQMSALVSDMDPYALDFPVCASQLSAGRHERHTLLKHIKRAGNKLGGYFPEDYEPCDSDWAATYLNRADVQTAIHAKIGTKWSDCTNINYPVADVNASMVPNWEFLKTQANLNLTIYSGDDDSVCATLGSQQFIWSMNNTIVTPWSPWKLNGQTGGFMVQFKGLTFITVHGAGHMVPATRPQASLYLFTSFLRGELNVH